MNTAHTLNCWNDSYAAARQNGANSVEAFDWAELYLAEGTKDCGCDPHSNRLNRTAWAMTRA